MVENFRCYIQHHALVWCLPKQFTQIYIMVFKNANGWYINFLKSFCHPRSRCWVHWSECEATLRVAEERGPRRWQDPHAHFWHRPFREQGLRGLLHHRRQLQSLAASPYRAHKVQEWRLVLGWLGARAIPRHVSPGQNKTMRKDRHHISEWGMHKFSQNHGRESRDPTLVKRSTSLFRAYSRPLLAQKLRRIIFMIKSTVLLAAGMSSEEGNSKFRLPKVLKCSQPCCSKSYSIVWEHVAAP
jgi:hypothetical protein